MTLRTRETIVVCGPQTGHTEDVVAQSGAAGSFLHKPFTAELLASTVRDALELL